MLSWFSSCSSADEQWDETDKVRLGSSCRHHPQGQWAEVSASKMKLWDIQRQDNRPGFCSGYSFINSNLQSKVLPGKSHQGVDFAFNFGYFTPLSQRYCLYYVIEILIWINLWWGNKANPKSCKLWASLWGKSSPVLEACLQCGRNNLSQKPEAKLFTSFQQQVACRPPKKGELDSFILKHSF